MNLDFDVNEMNGEGNTKIKEPKKGMAFESGEDFGLFCYEYAFKSGFEIAVRCHELIPVYKNQGIRGNGLGDKESKFHMMRRVRFECKTKECKVRIDARLQRDGSTGPFTITVFDSKHSHELEPSQPCFTKALETVNGYCNEKMTLGGPVGIGIRKKFIYRPLEKQGESNLICKERCNDIIREERRVRYTENSAILVGYFEKMKNQNSEFFYSIQFDSLGGVKTVFWADARCRALGKEFSDAVSFDTTFLSIMHKMPFAPFIGVNHHGKHILLAATLATDDCTETFIWLFEKWVECMGKAPSVMLTAQDRAIGDAIKKVFPNTPHRVCTLHILKNAPSHLGSSSNWEGIKRRLKFLVHDSFDKDEFQEAWRVMVRDFDLENNEWINNMYAKQKNWVPAYWRGEFCAGLSSARGNEEQNCFVKGFVSVDSGFHKFIEQFEFALKAKVEEEKELNLASAARPLPFSRHILLEAVFHNLYTNDKFQEVKDECDGLKHTNATVISKSDTLLLYEAREKLVDKPVIREEYKNFVVNIDKVHGDFGCSCKLFEFRGILCRHIARVIELENIKCIPEKYIKNRWRKDLVRSYEHIRMGYYDPEESDRVKRSVAVILNNDKLAAMVMHDDETYAIYQGWTDELCKELEDYMGIKTGDTSGLGSISTRVWCRRKLQNKEKISRHVARNVTSPYDLNKKFRFSDYGSPSSQPSSRNGRDYAAGPWRTEEFF